MGKIYNYRKSNGIFEFDFRDNRGQIILKSGEYTRKTIYIQAIQSVKYNSQAGTKFSNKRHLEVEYYFNMKFFNGKIIGISPIFNTEAPETLKRLRLKILAINIILLSVFFLLNKKGRKIFLPTMTTV